MVTAVRRIRRRYWAWIVTAVLVLIAIIFVWSRILAQRTSDRADRMIELMQAEGQEVERYASDLPPLPELPAPAEVEQRAALIADRIKTFSERLREWRGWEESARPFLPQAKQDEVRKALDGYAARVGRALSLLRQRAEQLGALSP